MAPFWLVVGALSYLYSFRWGPKLTGLKDQAANPEYLGTMRKLIFWGRVNLALSVAIIFCAALLRMNPF